MGDYIRRRFVRVAKAMGIRRNRDAGRASWASRFAPPGHFYSPFPSLDDIRRNEERLFGPPPRELPGIALNEDEQLKLLEDLSTYYGELPFPEGKTAGHRYYYENTFYSYSDAIFLFAMIRHIRPKHIIEVGSGYSSCVMLDTNELFFDNKIQCTFIDPFPQRLFGLISEADKDLVEIVPQRVQEVDEERFSRLGENDILFIDSSHISKVGSDVNHLFAEVLPALQTAVYVHFHDIRYPFEYWPEWIYEGRAFTEAYVLRAFLAFNDAFRIVLFLTFLEHFHRDWFARNMPLCLRNTGGSIWLRRA